MRSIAVAAIAVVVVGLSGSATAAEADTVGGVDLSQGLWYLRDSADDTSTFFYGNPGDFPIMGDWDCDGVDTPGMYRQSDGYVYLRNANSQGVADIRFFFGNPSDFPLAGDFNGDGCDTVSIYRPSEQRFYIINDLGADEGGLGAAELDYVFGDPGDKPFTGDFDGDGIDTVGLHRESTGLVYFRNSHTQGNADNTFIFGDPGDRFVAGDWTGDGIDAPGLFRPGGLPAFYLRYANTQGVADEWFFYREGLAPVAGDFGPLPGGESVFLTMDPGLTGNLDVNDPAYPELVAPYSLWDATRCTDEIFRCRIDVWERAGVVVTITGPDGTTVQESLETNWVPIRFIPSVQVGSTLSGGGTYSVTFDFPGGDTITRTITLAETRRVGFADTGLTRVTDGGTTQRAYRLGSLDLSDADYVGHAAGFTFAPIGFTPIPDVDSYYWLQSCGPFGLGFPCYRWEDHIFFARVAGGWYYALA